MGKITRHSWFTPVILTTWEAEMRRLLVLGQPRQKVSETPYQPIPRCSGMLPSSQIIRETEIGSTAVQANLGKKHL
jgi:hypothetical protein